MKRLYILLCLLGFSLPFFAQSISEKDVTRIVSTLAADEMNGRKSFTPDSKKAADFLSHEFKKIGLEFYNSLTSYEQTFNMYRLKPKQTEVVLNGKKIDESNMAYSGNYTNINRNNPPYTIAIKKGDNFRDSFMSINQLQRDVLVLVNPEHKNVFSWLKRRSSSGQLLFDINSGFSTFYILTEDSTVSNIQITIENTVETTQERNVIGILPGYEKKNEYVVFSAHYDHLGIIRPVEGDSVANGADDDASGTTAVVSLAKYFKEKKSNKRSILFVLFTAEEIGGYGSRYFSNNINPNEVVAMFNIEMIGKPSIFGERTGFITGYEKSSLGEIITRNLKNTDYQFFADPYPKQQLFYRSDNATLARLGVPAHSFSTDPIDKDPYYHQVSDEVKTLNLINMTNIIKAIAIGSQSIIDGKDTPTRIPKENN